MIRKGYLAAAILLTLFLLITALNTACKEPSSSYDRFPAFSPYQMLSSEDIAFLEDTFSLPSFSEPTTDEEVAIIADAIVTWQGNYMKQVSPQEKFDVSYPMRWNNIMPGVYPVSRMIRSRHIQEGETTKIYGLCWDYAAIFKAIADHYGLQTRITAYKMYMADDYHETGDLETTPNYGMGPAESNALMNRLSEINLSIPEYALNDAMVETYVHYRPEVFMGGAWESYDATSPSGAYADHPNYSLVNWYDGLNTLVAYR